MKKKKFSGSAPMPKASATKTGRPTTGAKPGVVASSKGRPAMSSSSAPVATAAASSTAGGAMKKGGVVKKRK